MNLIEMPRLNLFAQNILMYRALQAVTQTMKVITYDYRLGLQPVTKHHYIQNCSSVFCLQGKITSSMKSLQCEWNKYKWRKLSLKRAIYLGVPGGMCQTSGGCSLC